MQFAIGVGSNLGDREGAFALAESLLSRNGVRIRSLSSILETDAVGGPAGQRPYLNAAWIVETGLGPHQLLALLQSIENESGRTREIRNGPRTLDLDLLMERGGLVVETPVLTLPHPRLAERAFVLKPLAEVAGGWIHPLLKLSITELWRRNRDLPH